MRVLIQDRDVMILQKAQEEITQEEIPWQASYQSKMRRLRKLCKAGLLEMYINHRQKPNTYKITPKGQRVLQARQKRFHVKLKGV